MHSRLRDTPEWTKQAATPTVPLKIRKEQTLRCTKKRCKVAKGGKGWYSVLFTVHCMMETLKSFVN